MQHHSDGCACAVHLLCTLGVLALPQAATAQAIWHVDGAVSTNGNGMSWQTAFKTLEEALAESALANGDQIWVANGTYVPGTSQSDSFVIDDEEIAIYGGFEGYDGENFPDGESELCERDIRNPDNDAILSGEIGSAGISDNCQHVLFIVNPNSMGTDFSPRVDGFTITRGNADGSDEHSRGGGV